MKKCCCKELSQISQGTKWVKKRQKVAKITKIAQVDQSKNVTVRTYHKLSRDKNGPKNGQKVLKNAKKSQNTFHLISTVSKHWVKLNHEQWKVDVAKSATRFGKNLPKSATRFGKTSQKSATRLVQKVPKLLMWTNQKMLL